MVSCCTATSTFEDSREIERGEGTKIKSGWGNNYYMLGKAL